MLHRCAIMFIHSFISFRSLSAFEAATNFKLVKYRVRHIKREMLHHKLPRVDPMIDCGKVLPTLSASPPLDPMGSD